MKIKAYRLQGNTWLLVDPVGDEGQATVTAKDERGIKAQLADVAVITYGWHRPEIVLMSGRPPLNAARNAAGYVDASSVVLHPGDAVVFKTGYRSHSNDDEWLERNGDTVREVRGDEVKIGPSANDWAKIKDLMVWHNAARSRNSVVQKALNAWVPSRGAPLGHEWKETQAERRIKSALQSAGAKKADYLPWNHGTAKTGNYDTLSWYVVAHEDDIEKVATKMRQLGMIDVSKPKWDAYDDFYVVGYTKIEPIPLNADTSVLRETAVNGSDDAILRLCKPNNIIQRGKTENLHEVRYGGGYIYPVVSRDGVLTKVYGSLSEANRRTLNAARETAVNGKFRILVKSWSGPLYPFGESYSTREEAEKRVEELRRANAGRTPMKSYYVDEVANSACFANAKFSIGDEVVYKANGHRGEVKEIDGDRIGVRWGFGSSVEWHSADELKKAVNAMYTPPHSVSYFRYVADLLYHASRQIDKSGSGVSEMLAQAKKELGMIPKVSGVSSGSAVSEIKNLIDKADKSRSDSDLQAALKAATSAMEKYDRAISSRAANASTSRVFRPGEKVAWEYLDGDGDSGTVVADKGSFVEVKLQDGSIAKPAKAIITTNSSRSTNAVVSKALNACAVRNGVPWTREEKRALGSAYHPNGGFVRWGRQSVEFIHSGFGKYFVYKDGDGQYSVSFTPTDPYEKGWMKRASSIDEANRIMGTW